MGGEGRGQGMHCDSMTALFLSKNSFTAGVYAKLDCVRMLLSPSLFVYKYRDSGCYQLLPCPYILRASYHLILRPDNHPAAMCL
jgi:hypothetical protein